VLGFAAREVATARGLGPGARRALSLALVCLAALDAASATRNDINPKTTPVESESVAFRAAFGLPRPGDTFEPPIVAWRSFDAYMGPRLAKGQLIMVDTESAFPAVLFSRYPDQWVIPSDSDFQALAENFTGQFQWLLQTPSSITTSASIDIDQALSSTEGGHWRVVKRFGARIGVLYHWQPGTL
jgi:hypothetical protein